ncbi:MAG: hypothetical protein WDN67_03675 [Candidatus Moraniibacteriota bacterium]
MRINKGKILFFETCLADFLKKAGREHLPWRKQGVAAYEVWVSEIMLQQTQVSRVIEYYERFLKKFPTVGRLAKASWEEFLPYYQGLGYYARGRNMLKAAQLVVNEYQGIFPKDPEALRKIPGVGPYTAAAIASFAYGRKHLAWDTNLKRVFGRFFFGSKNAAFDEEAFEKELTLPRKKLNAALMDFGSSICTARPKCGACMLRTRCAYFREGGKQEQALVKKKSTFPLSEARAFVFLHENHRQYFSAAKKTFQPFFLPPGYNSRSGIKQWFKERYGLDLAVRPPHGKLFIDKKPTLLVNAQILLGKPLFPVFPKEAVKGYTKGRE